MDLEWPEPEDAGLSTLPTAYQMEWAPNTWLGEGVASPEIRLWHSARYRKGRIRGLTPGGEYCVRARLRNQHRWGEWSEYAVVAMPEAAAVTRTTPAPAPAPRPRGRSRSRPGQMRAASAGNSAAIALTDLKATQPAGGANATRPAEAVSSTAAGDAGGVDDVEATGAAATEGEAQQATGSGGGDAGVEVDEQA